MLIVMYSIGILGVGLKEILDRAFYAAKNTMLPAVNGFIIMAVNVTLSLVLTRFIGAYGIPLAYSTASLVGLCVLLALLRRKIGVFAKGLGMTLVKCLVSALVMAGAVLAVNAGLDAVLVSDSVLTRLIKLAVPACVGVLVYGVMVLVLRVNAVKPVLAKIKTLVKRGA